MTHHLTKSQTRLVIEAETQPVVCVSSYIGRSASGRVRRGGFRRRNAALTLQEAGMLVLVSINKTINMRHGIGETVTEYTYKLAGK